MEVTTSKKKWRETFAYRPPKQNKHQTFSEALNQIISK